MKWKFPCGCLFDTQGVDRPDGTEVHELTWVETPADQPPVVLRPTKGIKFCQGHEKKGREVLSCGCWLDIEELDAEWIKFEGETLIVKTVGKGYHLCEKHERKEQV